MSNYTKISNAIEIDSDKLENLLTSGEVTLYDVFSHHYMSSNLSKGDAKSLMYRNTFDFYIDSDFFSIIYDIIYDEYHSGGYLEVYNHLLDYEKVFQYVAE